MRLDLRGERNRSIAFPDDGAVSGGGAAVRYLSHSASLHSNENSAPSNSGIKQLGQDLAELRKPVGEIFNGNHGVGFRIRCDVVFVEHHSDTSCGTP